MKVLYCDCVNRDYVSEYMKRRIQGALVAAGIEVLATRDLCRMSVHGCDALKGFFCGGDISVVACEPRAVKSLLEYAGVELKFCNIRYYNLRIQKPDEILQDMGVDSTGNGRCQFIEADECQSDKWLPWYPVIDREKCTSCGKCLNFCLFGVYSRDGSEVVVESPDKCKPECPACSRVCPQGAVIFPKYRDAPVNGGKVADSGSGDVKAEVTDKPKDEDIYALLKKRRNMQKIKLFKESEEK